MKKRNRGNWTGKSRAYLAAVQSVLVSLRAYWPLTLRQVYYQLVAAGVIENNRGEYQKLSRILAKARIDELVPWESMEDRARSTLISGGWCDAEAFIEEQTGEYLRGYRRDLLADQTFALEAWIEKDALSHVAHGVAFDYCVPVIVARGFSSVSYVHESACRIAANGEQGKRTVILYFGDLDPSGWCMLPSMLETLQREMKLGDLVSGVRCALTPEQVEAYALPRNPCAIKEKDTRTREYMERFGDLAVELDALPPATLEALVREAIESHLDMSAFQEARDLQDEEREQIGDLRQRVHGFIGEEMGIE